MPTMMVVMNQFFSSILDIILTPLITYNKCSDPQYMSAINAINNGRENMRASL